MITILLNKVSNRNKKLWHHGILGVALTATLLASALALLLSNHTSIPHLFADEWVVTHTIVSNPFPDSVLAGHNGAPTYFQNGLWLLDFHLFDYAGTAPRLAMLGGLLLGILGMIFFLWKTDLPKTTIGWILVLILSLWFTHVNRMHYGEYVWRGTESSLVLLFLFAVLIAAARYLKQTDSGANGSGRVSLVLSFAAAWLALYVHGGFPILPLLAFILGISVREWRTRSLMIAVAVLFIWHFSQVHYSSPPGAARVDEVVKNIVLCVMIFPSTMAFKMLEQMVGAAAAACVALTLTLAGIALMFVAMHRLVSGKERVVSLMVFFFLAYPLVIGLGIAYVRAQYSPGWVVVFSDRYSNYSIYFLVGATLAMLCYTREYPRSGVIRGLRWACFLIVLPVGALGLLDGLGNLKHLGLSTASNQAYMIPFTLQDWTLPPRETTTPVRTQHSEKFHDILKKEQKHVFGSRQYLAYKAALNGSVSPASTPSCRISWDLLRKDAVDGGFLFELRGRFDPAWAEIPGSVLFFGQDARPLGWAVRFKEWDIVSRSPAGSADRTGAVVWGYLRTTTPPEGAGIRTVLVSDNNEVLCISEQVTGAEPG